MGFITKQEETFDKYRFGIMSIMVMVQSSYLSLAAYLSILNDNWFFVSIAAVSSMGANAMFLAQAKARVCLIGFWLSMAIGTIIILVNIPFLLG